MLPVGEAEAIVLNLVQPLGERDVEILDLLAAPGRILASPVAGKLDVPHWDNSAMDGYAVKYEDVKNASESNPAVLEIKEEIPAGKQPQMTVQPGQAARIFTGSMMPLGADTVIMQEQTRRRDNLVEILVAPPAPGDFVRHRGEFYQAMTPLLQPGVRLAASDIAVLASAQATEVPVFRRPRIAIFSTGDELVGVGEPIGPGQLVDSNQYALAVAATAAGCEAVRLGIVKDDKRVLQEAIDRALKAADVVISTGGVSVGEYDYVEEIILSLGGTIHITSVAIKPGKPLTVATFPQKEFPGAPPKLYFGLPGNPVSTLVTFWRFVEPALKKLSGITSGWGPLFVPARTRQDLRTGGQRETYLWGKIHPSDTGWEFELAAGSHSSGNLINLAQTTGLAVVPVGQKAIAAGETVLVLVVSEI